MKNNTFLKYLAIANLLLLGLGCGEDPAPEEVIIIIDEDMAQDTMDMTMQDAGGQDDMTMPQEDMSPDMVVEDEDMAPDMTDMEVAYQFPDEEVACALNPRFEEAKPILAGGKNNPTGRGEQGAVYDPCHQRVVLFGGNDEQPAQCNSFGPKNYVADTWAYSLEHENWYRINSAQASAPSARGRHATALDLSRKRMMLFGGRFRPAGQTGNYTMYNELWAFDLNDDTWHQIEQKGDIPGARFNTAMIYDPVRDRLILFGGNSNPNGLNLTPLDDTYSFDLKTNTWTKHDIARKPSARLYHAMTYDPVKDQAVIFSGGDENAFLGPFFSDIWGLNLATMTWSLLHESSRRPGAPLGRINPSLLADPENKRVLLFGGHDDSALGNSNDLWAFDVESNAWEVVRAGDVYTGDGCNSFCSCADTFVEYDYESPERRQYATFVKVEGEQEAILFSGTGDCGYMDDTWALDLDANTWTEVQAAEQGIACARTGRQDCTELCY